MSCTKTIFQPTFERTATPEAKPLQYNAALGYLRAFVVILVIAHHAALAYHSYAPKVSGSLASQPRWWPAFPVVDGERWEGFTLFVAFNDIFFMSLMFFLSGLFVWSSLQRKGACAFLQSRMRRFVLPFVVGAAILAPLAYYPAYLQRSTDASASSFVDQWLALGAWYAGPVWFIGVLLVFDLVAAAWFSWGPRWRIAATGPARTFAVLTGITAAAYIPMAVLFGQLDWFQLGPFSVQKSRVFLYLVYFLAGVGIGAYGIQRGLLDPDGKLARRWPLWVLAAVLAFGLAIAALIVGSTLKSPSAWMTAVLSFPFVLSCAASVFACLGVFLRFVKTRIPLFDQLAQASYGIYLVHYALVSWLQYALVDAALPGLAKWFLVTAGALLLSWCLIASVRRIPAVAQVI